MEIVEARVAGIVILRLKGRLDIITADELEKKQKALIDSGESALVFNLEDVEYISSAGLRVFLLCAQAMERKQGALAFCCIKTHVLEIFKVTGFATIFQIFRSESKAVDAVSQKSNERKA